MNDRIKELVLQMGWEEMGSDLYGKSMDGCMTSHALEKFAELIIKDCILTIQLKMICNGPNTPENIQSKQHVNNIAEKFGIILPIDYANLLDLNNEQPN